MKFSLSKFYEFCGALKVDSKERGLISLAPENLLGTQRYLIEEIASNLEKDIHYFVILKGRQQGISTICLALDLFWVFMNRGLSGSLVAHEDKARDMFKSTLDIYMDGLPNAYKIPPKAHNRNQLVLANRSKLLYQVAGTKKNSNFGRGNALTFLHATEVSSWGDPEGRASLEASLAEHNEDRLYLWESTARGPNMFMDMWETARRAKTQKAIFVGWWRNEFYRAKKGTTIYEVYWDGRLSPEERQWAREVKKLYGYDITDEQVAWWRYQVNEVIKDDQFAQQEHPWTEEYAFVLTGSQFFSAKLLNDDLRATRQKKAHHYKFIMSGNFEDTELVPSNSRLSTLKIWDFPVAGAYYVIGADPAWGSSEWADRFCASVWRCYSDGMDQVAEFCTSEINTYQFAWVLAYLAGAYKNAMLNLEINGPGQAVQTELANLKRLAANTKGALGAGLVDVLSNMQSYLYRRVDQIWGAPSAMHWKTTADSKERMMNLYKDGIERRMLVPASEDLILEMKNVIREDGSLGAPGRGKDDRVIASALATVAWSDFVQPRLIAIGVNRKNEQSRGSSEIQPVAKTAVTNYLKRIGIAQPL